MNQETRSTISHHGLAEVLATDRETVLASLTQGLDAEVIRDCRAAIEALEFARGVDEPVEVEPLTPDELPGDYELGALIGHGGMGAVYRAWQRSLDREVAVKVLRVRDAVSESAVRRFRREASSLARLRHPHIVPVHEVGEAGGTTYFTMPLIRGESLDSRLRSGPLSPSRAVRLLREIASAVAHAHSQGIVHRDLKPGNVLIDEHGDAQVVDFGLATDSLGEGSVTQGIVGTPAYMSPEQARGRRELVGEPTDVHALGAILHECLTGRPAFLRDSVGETLRAVTHATPPRLRSVDRRIPAELQRICDKALAKQISDRYPNAGAFEADLRAFEEGRPISVRSGGLVARLLSDRRRRRVLLTATAVGVVLGIVAILSYQSGRRAPRGEGGGADPQLVQVAERLRYEGAFRSAGLVYEEMLGEVETAGRDRRELLTVAADTWLDAATLAFREGDDRRRSEALARARPHIAERRSLRDPTEPFDDGLRLHARAALLSGGDFMTIRNALPKFLHVSERAIGPVDVPRTVAFYGERAVDPEHLEHELGLFALTCHEFDRAPRDRWLLEDPARLVAFTLSWVHAEWVRAIPDTPGTRREVGRLLYELSAHRPLSQALREARIADSLVEIATDEERPAPVRTLAAALIADVEDLPRGPATVPGYDFVLETTPELEREVVRLYRELSGTDPVESFRYRTNHAVTVWMVRHTDRFRAGERVDRRLRSWLYRLIDEEGSEFWEGTGPLCGVSQWWAERRERDPRDWLREAIGLPGTGTDASPTVAQIVEWMRRAPKRNRRPWWQAHLLGELLLPPEIRAPSWNYHRLALEGSPETGGGIPEAWERVLQEVQARDRED